MGEETRQAQTTDANPCDGVNWIDVAEHGMYAAWTDDTTAYNTASVAGPEGAVGDAVDAAYAAFVAFYAAGAALLDCDPAFAARAWYYAKEAAEHAARAAGHAELGDDAIGAWLDAADAARAAAAAIGKYMKGAASYGDASAAANAALHAAAKALATTYNAAYADDP